MHEFAEPRDGGPEFGVMAGWAPAGAVGLDGAEAILEDLDGVGDRGFVLAPLALNDWRGGDPRAPGAKEARAADTADPGPVAWNATPNV